MTREITITSQVVAQGSYGLNKINPVNGVRIGDTIKVWHVMRDGHRLNTYLTRREARECVRGIRQSARQF